MNISKNTGFKMAMLLPIALILVVFSLSLNTLSSPVSMSAFPEVPKEAEPVLLTIDLRNPQLTQETYVYELYANGEKVLEGLTKLNPLSSKQIRYSYENLLELGEQTNFFMRVKTEGRVYEKTISMPTYPPQLWSSFVSFASFATSMATFSSSMGLTSMANYQDAFGVKNALNVGAIFSIVLIALLFFVDMTGYHPFTGTYFERLYSRFRRLSGILLVIFGAMAMTQILMIMGGL